MGSSAPLHALASCTLITPEMLVLLYQAWYSIVNMCSEDSCPAPAPADGTPIHEERILALPLNRQLLPSPLTPHRASRVGDPSFRYLDLCLVEKGLPPFAIMHARINAKERHLATSRGHRPAEL